MDSPFLDQSRWIASNDLAAAVRDRYPVSPGHTLIVPQRAVPTVFDCTADEIAAVWRLLEDCKKAIDTEFTPDGYNIGINGTVALAGVRVEVGSPRPRPLRDPGMNAFKLRRFHAVVILQCVRWYCKYAISYRQLEEMMAERGVMVDHTTIWRWIQHYAPRLEKEIRWYQGHTSGSWRVDETCIRVNGEWKWLFRAVDKHGRTVDFLLTHRRNAKAARRFLAKALRTRQQWPPHLINTDQNPAYGEALRQLKGDDPDVGNIEHRQAKYLNNRIEADHGPIKRLCRATLGFKSMKTAYATIKGFEVMRMIRKRQCILLEHGVMGEVRLVNKLFALAA